MNSFLILCAFLVAGVAALPAPVEHAFDLSEFDISVSSNRDTKERFDCLQDGSQKMFDANPDLYWWFDEASATTLKLIDGFEKCEALSGISQARCMVKFQTGALLDLRKLLKRLPDDKKIFLKEARAVVKNCLTDYA